MYIIYYNDGTSFKGGPYYNSKWKEAPNKPIIKIEYTWQGKTLILKDFEAYNHILEYSQPIFGQLESLITKIILMGKKKTNVHCIIFNLVNKTVYTETREFGKEFYGKPTNGWKN